MPIHKKSQNTSLPVAREFITRREASQITGISIPTWSVMAHDRRGPVCIIPSGFSYNMYFRSDVLKWMNGAPIPAWPKVEGDPLTPLTNGALESKRGLHLVPHKGPGRPKKKPKKHKAQGDVFDGTGEVS